MKQCNYCNQIANHIILHLCNDDEYHFIDRIDLTEEPLIELTEEVKEEIEINFYNTKSLRYPHPKTFDIHNKKEYLTDNEDNCR